MDQNFQTSFIPKKPIVPERSVQARPVSFFMIASIFVFFTVLVASLGLYLYRNVVTNNITKMQNDLAVAKNRFEPSIINELQVLDKRLIAATQILKDHVAISPIFGILEGITMKTVQYTKFNYELDAEKKEIMVQMQGVATGYRSIALQGDLFSGNNSLIDPVFSDLKLDDKGNVSFKLDFRVEAALVNYKNILSSEDEFDLMSN